MVAITYGSVYCQSFPSVPTTVTLTGWKQLCPYVMIDVHTLSLTGTHEGRPFTVPWQMRDMKHRMRLTGCPTTGKQLSQILPQIQEHNVFFLLFYVLRSQCFCIKLDLNTSLSVGWVLVGLLRNTECSFSGLSFWVSELDRHRGNQWVWFFDLFLVLFCHVRAKAAWVGTGLADLSVLHWCKRHLMFKSFLLPCMAVSHPCLHRFSMASAATPLRQRLCQPREEPELCSVQPSFFEQVLENAGFPGLTLSSEHFWSHLVQVAVGKLSSNVSWEGQSVQE